MDAVISSATAEAAAILKCEMETSAALLVTSHTASSNAATAAAAAAVATFEPTSTTSDIVATVVAHSLATSEPEVTSGEEQLAVNALTTATQGGDAEEQREENKSEINNVGEATEDKSNASSFALDAEVEGLQMPKRRSFWRILVGRRSGGSKKQAPPPATFDSDNAAAKKNGCLRLLPRRRQKPGPGRAEQP
eukprot:UC1_evm1s417